MRPLLLTLILAACVSAQPLPEAPDAYRAEAFSPPPPGANLTLLPTQETQYDELREGAELMQKQLQKQLTAAGYKVTVLKKDDYLEQWKQEAAAAGGVLQPDGQFKSQAYLQALTSLMRKSCAATQCALLIDARLVVRPAELIDGKVEWDGRKMMSADAVVRRNTAERTYGLSVEVSGIQPSGSISFKTYGGVALPPQYSLDDMKNFKNKPMAWTDSDLSAGLKIALRPLFAPSAAASAAAPATVPAAPPAAPR